MVVLSLAVEVIEVDGTFVATAPWLEEPVTGASSVEAFTKAMNAPKRAWSRFDRAA
jgi:hypothetical protein